MYNLNQFFSPTSNVVLLCGLALSLSACSSGTRDKITLDPNKTVNAAFQAATSPLDDLNLRRKDIPELLQKVAANPYALLPNSTCPMVREEVAQLDSILGPDIAITNVVYTSSDGEFSVNKLAERVDIPDEMPETSTVVNKAGKMAEGRVIGFIRDQTNILPFRSIVRKITGAEKHQEKVDFAFEAGKLRRAYLKGYAMNRFGVDCLSPPVVEAKIEQRAAEVTTIAAAPTGAN